MKIRNKVIFVVVLLCSLFFVGCNEKQDELTPMEKALQKIEETVPKIATEDFELITEIPELDAYIEWNTSNFDVLSPSGRVNPHKLKAQLVTLTYNIFIGEETEEGNIDVVVSPVSIEEVCLKFEDQFSTIINHDYKVSESLYDLFEVSWTSSDTLIFDNDGIYHKPVDDTNLEISYQITCNGVTTDSKKFTRLVAGTSDIEKSEEITLWLKEEVLTDLYLDGNMKLPDKYEKYNVKIEWLSSNPDVITNSGVIRHYVYERFVTLFARYEFEDGTGYTFKYECSVSPLDITKMSEKEIVEDFLDSIAVSEYSQVRFGYSACPDLSRTFGHLYFYLNQDAKVKEMLIPLGQTNNRWGEPMTPELIVVHDTANYRASAFDNAKYCQNGYSGQTTSWHYTVGNDGIFQTLPSNECGGHANGSTSQKFRMIDTGIKATAKKPQTFIDENGFICIGKQKTRIKVPNTSYGYADFGIMCEVGANGNYHIAESWDCKVNGRNAVKGGNGSGIGIETSVQAETDYLLTMRKLAKLIAELLIKYDLTVDRVVQHNTTSGKNCPQAIREANFMYTLKDYVSLEKFAKEHLANYQFAWKSNSEIMDNTGAISLNLNNHTEVSYSVVASVNSKEVVSKTYTTKLVVK